MTTFCMRAKLPGSNWPWGEAGSIVVQTTLHLLANPVANRSARSSRLGGDGGASDLDGVHGLPCAKHWLGMRLDCETVKSRLPSFHRRGRTETWKACLLRVHCKTLLFFRHMDGVMEFYR